MAKKMSGPMTDEEDSMEKPDFMRGGKRSKGRKKKRGGRKHGRY